MSHVVCLLNVEEDRATFTWSEGPASFEPYRLEGGIFADFQEVVSDARAKLSNLVKDYLFDEENLPHASLALAETGHELYRQMFDPCAGQARMASDVRKWLESLTTTKSVDTLEIVVESPWAIPWNVVYDQEPDKGAFLSIDNQSLDRWTPFWAIRYDVTGGRKVSPLRRMPVLSDPHVLLVVVAESNRHGQAKPDRRDPGTRQDVLGDRLGRPNQPGRLLS